MRPEDLDSICYREAQGIFTIEQPCDAGCDDAAGISTIDRPYDHGLRRCGRISYHRAAMRAVDSIRDGVFDDVTFSVAMLEGPC